MIDWKRNAGPVRTFSMLRLSDETGISGTGVVAHGACFADGTPVLRWTTERSSTAIYSSMDELEAIHGHGRKTRIAWHDEHWRRGFECAVQDSMENCYWGSIGGKSMREPAEPFDALAIYAGDSDDAGWIGFLAGYMDVALESKWLRGR